jgi:hydroxyacylglutathione hydrolase
MLQLRALPALQDNYIWVLAAPDGRALVVDPGESAPVMAATREGLVPVAILLTHHHADHVAGAAELRERWRIPCYAPPDPRISTIDIEASADVRVHIPALDATFEVIDVPGHTRSHVAYFGAGRLFCGDTLFSLGCGRMFEGTPAQMLDSLDRIAALDAEADVCCGHEYTLANAAFASMIEPGNRALERRVEQATRQRAAGRPSVPSTIADERATNPFLRTREAAVVASVADRLGRAPVDRIETFATLRAWKDGFRAA